MPFEKLEFEPTATKVPMATVSYMPTAGRGRNVGAVGKRPRLVIYLPKLIYGEGASGTFVLELGSGKDTGKLRVVRIVSDDCVKPTELKQVVRFNFGYVARLGDDMFDRERLPVRKIAEGIFEIDVIAEWFEPDAAGDE